jgi:hypothetical protein
MSDAQIIWNSKANLKVQHRNDEKTTTLHITQYGEQLAIYVSIETEYPKRTTYTGSTFRCGPDMANMIAKACTMEALTGNTAETVRHHDQSMETSS